ncbi:LAGLIDADG family homing endonuclease [Streptomyces griseoincarnatus]|uniref:LAGLIDADG family homing endonuclease n=1 Tax=Streptomyces griseoincarnatus TaxID=29305 RepID=A0ABT0VZC8_STRGI|nr:LAGLIDADG family homing endonuclease [Streptomyces griseoincarnatus]MCM2516694.1 LAGLIDADG family homing endonuclease [Streptomyces griseoincarnatus]
MDLTVPEYAYMFGFLQADGHLEQGDGQRGRLTVEISARDIDLLREFQRLTPYSSSVSERTRSTNFAATHTSATWTLCSLEARTILHAVGLPYGRKSDAIAPPSGSFSGRDYLRGLVDADGSVGRTSKGFPFVSLTTASTAIARYFCEYVQEVTGVHRAVKRNARDGIYNVMVAMEAAQRLAAKLYYPGCLALARKQTAAGSLATWGRPACETPIRHAGGRQRRTASCYGSTALRPRPRLSAELGRAAISACGDSGPGKCRCPAITEPIAVVPGSTAGDHCRQPLTQTTCFSFATTSTRSRCWSMTCSIGL